MSVRKDFVRAGGSVRVSCERSGGETFRVQVGDATHEVAAHVLPDGRIAFHLGGDMHVAAVAPAANGAIHARVDGHTFTVHTHRGRGVAGAAGGNGVLVAPMTGTVLDVFVKNGEGVERGDTVALLSAMKMEHKIVADVTGKVAEIGAQPGDAVEQGRLLVRVDPTGEPG